jgi:membrane protein YqaA with SNARE-associated domain
MTYVPHQDGQPADPTSGATFPHAPTPYAPTPPAYSEYPQPGPGFGAPAQEYSGQVPGAAGYGYPTPGYGYPAPPGYGYGYGQQGPRRPGTVIASSVLAYVLAGLLIVAGIFLLSLASTTDQLFDTFNGYGNNLTAELSFDGFLDLVTAGLLIGGAVGFTTGRRAGRTLLIVGNTITVGDAIYWLVRTSTAGSAAVWIVLFSALAIVGTVLALSAPINVWLAQRSAAAQQPSPYPR